MDKHGNTFFPGDMVVSTTSGKTAAERVPGKVVDADPDSSMVKVAWPNGEEVWIDANKLTKT